MSEFKMPSLGADMEAGTLVAWHKHPGEKVQRGDLIADVETDKGVISVEAFSSGVLEKLVAEIGTRVPVGTTLALIQDDAPTDLTAISTTSSPGVAATESKQPIPQVEMQKRTSHALNDVVGIPSHKDAERVPMSPSARRLARELGIDPHTIRGTGPRAAVTREDIQRTANLENKPKTSTEDVTNPVPAADRNARMRQTIAAAMTRSKREIPHYYLSTTIDMYSAMKWLAEYNEARPVPDRLLYGVLLMKAVAKSLHVVPELNATWENKQVILKQGIHIGAAISLRQGGLLAPAIHDVDQKSLAELMVALCDLVTRTRTGGLRASELSDATITVTSLGENGVESVFGVIYPPQVAIVGFGKIVERPWSIDGRVFTRPVMTATLSADHRVSDGHRGGLFLATIDKLLQEPAQL